MKKKLIVIGVIVIALIAAAVTFFCLNNDKEPAVAIEFSRHDGTQYKTTVFDDFPEELEVIELEGEKYKMTFFDDFNGTKLDKKKWMLCTEKTRQDVGGKWDDSMTSLDGNGNLILTSAINSKGTPISGAVCTYDRFYQARGYFETRCRLQKSPGFWSAFWLYTGAQPLVGNGAVDGAEIDIFESFNIYGGINHAVHWDGYGDDHKIAKQSSFAPEVYDGNFHTFSMLWTEDAYIYYIDGKETYRLDATDGSFPGSCEVPCFLLLSNEFGSWAGKYDPEQLPDDVAVDYVKVYQKVD